MSDTNLCWGKGHGTIGSGLEPLDDAQHAVQWVRNHASTYRVDSTRGIGAVGFSSGGLMAADLTVKGTVGDTRIEAAVTWSSCMHMEKPPTGQNEPNPQRERVVGCPYSGSQDACPDAWDDYSPYHNCCSGANLTAASPLLMFNSNNEFLDDEETNEMYGLLADTGVIPVTKVILSDAGHFNYPNEVVNSAEDVIRSANYPDPPGDPIIDGKEVQVATADFLLAQL